MSQSGLGVLLVAVNVNTGLLDGLGVLGIIFMISTKISHTLQCSY